MTDLTSQVALATVLAYDFSGSRVAADIGEFYSIASRWLKAPHCLRARALATGARASVGIFANPCRKARTSTFLKTCCTTGGMITYGPKTGSY